MSKPDLHRYLHRYCAGRPRNIRVAVRTARCKAGPFERGIRKNVCSYLRPAVRRFGLTDLHQSGRVRIVVQGGDQGCLWYQRARHGGHGLQRLGRFRGRCGQSGDALVVTHARHIRGILDVGGRAVVGNACTSNASLAARLESSFPFSNDLR